MLQQVVMLEQKVDQLSVELQSSRAELESCLHDLESSRAELHAMVSSDRIEDIEKRLVDAENELAAGDVLRDNLRADKEKVCNAIATIFYCSL